MGHSHLMLFHLMFPLDYNELLGILIQHIIIVFNIYKVF